MPAERLDRSLLRGRASRGPPVCPRGRGLINEARDPVAKDRPAWRTSAQQRDSYGSSDSGGATLLRVLGARLTHLRRLEFGDDRYTCNRLVNHIDDDSFNHGGAWRLHCPHVLPRLLCPTFEPSLGQTLLWDCLPYDPFRRSSGLRALRAAVDFPFSCCWSLLPLSHDRRLSW